MKKIILLALCLFSINAFSQDLIRVVNVVHHIDGVTEFQGEFRVPLPTSLQSILNAPQILESYKTVYNIVKLDTIANMVYAVFLGERKSLGFFKVVNNVTTTTPCTANDYYTILEEQYNEFVNGLDNFQIMPSDEIIGKRFNGTTWDY